MNKQQYQALSRQYRLVELPADHPLYPHFMDIEQMIYCDPDLPYDDVPQALYHAVSAGYRNHIGYLLVRWCHQDQEARLDRMDAWGWA